MLETTKNVFETIINTESNKQANQPTTQPSNKPPTNTQPRMSATAWPSKAGSWQRNTAAQDGPELVHSPKQENGFHAYRNLLMALKPNGLRERENCVRLSSQCWTSSKLSKWVFWHRLVSSIHAWFRSLARCWIQTSLQMDLHRKCPSILELLSQGSSMGSKDGVPPPK